MEEEWEEEFNEFYDKWCENSENTATRAYMEFSPSDMVKSLRSVMKEAFLAAKKSK